MSTKELSRKELIEQSFNCCIETVKSYGPPIKQCDRDGLIACMQHFKDLYTGAVEKELENG